MSKRATADSVKAITRKKYPNHVPISEKGIAQNIYIYPDELDGKGESEIVFLEYIDQRNAERGLKTFTTDGDILKSHKGNKTGTGYITAFFSDIAMHLKPETTEFQFACIAREILAAHFIYSFKFANASERPCVFISHASCWSHDTFKDTATKVANIILEYPAHVEQRVTSSSENIISSTPNIKIIWKQMMRMDTNPRKQSPACILGLNATAVDTTDFKIIPCDLRSYVPKSLIQPYTRLLFHTRDSIIEALYVSSNLLPDLRYGLASGTNTPYIKTGNAADLYCYSIAMDSSHIKYGKRIDELIKHTKTVLKDKTKLLHVIAGLINTKYVFNADMLRAHPVKIYCESTQLNGDTCLPTLLLWTKYITAQKNLDELNKQTSSGRGTDILEIENKDEEYRAEFVEDMVKQLEYDHPDGEYEEQDEDFYRKSDTQESEPAEFKIKINPATCPGAGEVNRTIVWAFDQNGLLIVYEESEAHAEDIIESKQEYRPGNGWDMAAHFNLEDTVSRLVTHMDMYCL